MGVPSCERPSSPSIFASTAMTKSRQQSNSQKRPKLSLQTSSLPVTFGKSSTALTITASALPPASPTVLNTFSNAYDMPHRFSPAGASPTTRSVRPVSRLVSPFASGKDDRPYQVSLGLKSILRNSPIPTGLRRSSLCAAALCAAAESPRTGRKAFFPAAKKVTFRAVLEEEIKTTAYIAKHSDLSSDEEEDSDSDERSEPSLSSADESDAEEFAGVNTGSQATRLGKKRKAGSTRQIQAAAIRDCLSTVERIPKRLKRMSERRRKRKRRHWEWTLEPLMESSPQAVNTLRVGSSGLSLSQVLPSSAVLNPSETRLSPSKIPLPSSATFAPLENAGSSGSPSPSQILLPPSSTLPSPASSTRSAGAEEESINLPQTSRTKS